MPIGAADSLLAAGVNAMATLHNANILDLYTDPQPAKGAAITTQTLIVSVTLPNPAFGTATTGTANGSSVVTGTAVAAGIPTWGRIRTSGGVFRMDLTVGVSGKDLILSHAEFAIGQQLQLAAFALELAEKTT